MKQILAVVFSLVCAVSINAQVREPSALTARQIAQNTFPSVVVLVTEDARGDLSTLGSGFFIQGDVIATNYHVIENASRIYVKVVGQRDVYGVSGSVGMDREHDLALLKVVGVKAPYLSLGDINDIAVGDIVYAAGNPEGLEGTFSQGIISALRGKRYIQITAPISHGSSGGPILNQKGEVIGVASSGIEEGQNLNFAVPVSDLISLTRHMSSTVSPLPTPIPVTSQANQNIKTERGSNPQIRPQFSRPARCRERVFPNEVLEDAGNFKKLMKHGEMYLQTQQYENAIGVYDRAIYFKPLLAVPYYKMSIAYSEIGCIDEAILAAKQAVANDPKSALYKEHLNRLSTK